MQAFSNWHSAQGCASRDLDGSVPRQNQRVTHHDNSRRGDFAPRCFIPDTLHFKILGVGLRPKQSELGTQQEKASTSALKTLDRRACNLTFFVIDSLRSAC
jgi:hypothetical protein